MLKRMFVGLLLIGGTLFLKFGGLSWLLSDVSAAHSLNVGDCVMPGRVDEHGNQDLVYAECTGTSARRQVLEVIEDTTESLGDVACTRHRTYETYYFEHREGETTGMLICLGTISR